jgi:hypothetical protein
MTRFEGNVAKRLSTIAARVRERAVASGTFDVEVAADVEELARFAAVVADITRGVNEMSDAIDALRD